MLPSAAIVIDSLVVRRGGRIVLPGVSLTISTGSVTGLVGPSGSGKTTLMRAVVGVQVVAEGSVTVLGLPGGAPELRRRVGYVTQSPSIYGDLTARENLRYFAALFDLSESDLTVVADTVGLADKLDQLVSTMSGGERSRVSLAVALLSRPEVLVLDEPTVGLDPVLRRDLWETVHQLAREGTTLLISTHVMDEANHCADLVLLRDGEVLASSTPRELLDETGADDLEGAFLSVAEGASS